MSLIEIVALASVKHENLRVKLEVYLTLVQLCKVASELLFLIDLHEATIGS